MALQRATDSRPVVGDCILDRVGGLERMFRIRDMRRCETALGADLGGSSNYSTATVED